MPLLFSPLTGTLFFCREASFVFFKFKTKHNLTFEVELVNSDGDVYSPTVAHFTH